MDTAVWIGRTAFIDKGTQINFLCKKLGKYLFYSKCRNGFMTDYFVLKALVFFNIVPKSVDRTGTSFHWFWCLIRICTICLNNMNLRVKWNSVKAAGPIMLVLLVLLLGEEFSQPSHSDNRDASAVSALIFVWEDRSWNYFVLILLELSKP